MGVFGIIGNEKTKVASSVYYGLYALQHRGQESAGIVVNDDGVFTSHKASGIVNDVFSSRDLDALGEGNMALGHVRYGTPGTKDQINAEPIVVNHTKNFSTNTTIHIIFIYRLNKLITWFTSIKVLCRHLL